MSKTPNSSTFRELLRDPHKKYDETNHPLAKLLRDVMASRGIMPSQWDTLVERYYRKVYTNRRGEIDLIKVNQEKSNLTRALAKDRVPFDRFDVALQILGCAYYLYSVETTDTKGVKITNKLKITNRYVILPEVVEKDDDVDDCPTVVSEIRELGAPGEDDE